MDFMHKPIEEGYESYVYKIHTLIWHPMWQKISVKYNLDVLIELYVSKYSLLGQGFALVGLITNEKSGFWRLFKKGGLALDFKTF